MALPPAGTNGALKVVDAGGPVAGSADAKRLCPAATRQAGCPWGGEWRYTRGSCGCKGVWGLRLSCVQRVVFRSGLRRLATVFNTVLCYTEQLPPSASEATIIADIITIEIFSPFFPPEILIHRHICYSQLISAIQIWEMQWPSLVSFRGGGASGPKSGCAALLPLNQTIGRGRRAFFW